jgi:hypothetical protein
MSKHTVSGAVASLNQKNDLLVKENFKGGTIYRLAGNKAKGDVGIGSKGKIDFLVNHHGFVTEWTDDFQSLRN